MGFSDEIELNHVEGYSAITTNNNPQYLIIEPTDRHGENFRTNSEFDMNFPVQEDEAMSMSGDGDDVDNVYSDTIIENSSLSDAFMSSNSSRAQAIPGNVAISSSYKTFSPCKLNGIAM